MRESGVSLPDINLLIPLADALDISAAELLQCQKNADAVPLIEVNEAIEKTISISNYHFEHKMKLFFQPAVLISAFIAVYFIQFFLFPAVLPSAFPKSFLAFILLIGTYSFLIFIGLKWISDSLFHWLLGILVNALLILWHSADGAYNIIPALDSSHNSITVIYFAQELSKFTPFLIGFLILAAVFIVKHFKEFSSPSPYSQPKKKSPKIQIRASSFLIIWNILVFSIFGYCLFQKINLLFYLWSGIALIGGFFLITDGYCARTLDTRRGLNIEVEAAHSKYDLKQRRKTAAGSTFSNTVAYMTIPLLICIVLSMIFF